MKKKIKVGITGGYGFLGSNLYNHLKTNPNDYEISIYDGDILDKDHLEIWTEGLNNVVHFAAKIKGDANEIFMTNMISSLHILNACYKNKCILHFAGIIFPSNTIAGLNTTKDAQKGFYAESKAIFDECLDIYDNLYLTDDSKINVTSYYYRLPNVIGVGCKPFYNSFLSTLMYCIANDRPYKHLIQDENAVIRFCTTNELNNSIEEKLSLYHVGGKIVVNILEHFISIKNFIDLCNGADIVIDDQDFPYEEIKLIFESYKGFKV